MNTRKTRLRSWKTRLRAVLFLAVSIAVFGALAWHFAGAKLFFWNRPPGSYVAALPQVQIFHTSTPGLSPFPSYQLTLSGDGRASFDGQYFVQTGREQDLRPKFEQRAERHAHQVSAPQMRALLAAFDAIDFWSLPDSYERVDTTCGGRDTFSLTAYGRTKTIRMYSGDNRIPKRLWDLQEKVDAVGSVRAWMDGTVFPLQEAASVADRKVIARADLDAYKARTRPDGEKPKGRPRKKER